MKISLIYETASLGGLDMLWESVRFQTMLSEDFELIIVDDWHKQRQDALADYLQGSDLRCTHIPPKQTGVSYHNSASFNTGLALAMGELVIFLVDFVWLPEDFLEWHWRFYQEHPGYSLSAYVDRYKYPPIVDGKLTIFDEWFDRAYAEKWLVDGNLIYQERKGGTLNREIARGVYEMSGNRIYMLGDSVPLAVMKELNGWDERYDGGYSCNDLDIGLRANMLGWKFAVDLTAPTLKKLGDKSMAHLLPTIKTEFVRQPEDNYRMFQERIKAINEGREPIAVPDGRGAWA